MQALEKLASAFLLGHDPLSLDTLVHLGEERLKPILDPAALQDLAQARKKMEAHMHPSQPGGEMRAVYGVNTGFGFFSTQVIPKADCLQLQVNLVRSHACGVGTFFSPEIVRGILALKIHNFLQGGSGIRAECVSALYALLEHDILPLIPNQGSVGASGDLAPLAHMALALLGEGEVWAQGVRMPAGEALTRAGLSPYALQEKEGLSLLNGTQVMGVLAAFVVHQAQQLLVAADIIAALSLVAFRANREPFDARIHQLKPHPGQIWVAHNIRTLLELPESHFPPGTDRVQDPYSFRCIPQVHGAARDGVQYCREVINREINSTTDNPVLTSDGALLSGGNFHGQYVAQVMDLARIVLTDLSSISERRIDKLLCPQFSGLPALLTSQGGLESGFMIPQYVAAALVSENKVLSHPASVDTIPTSLNKEDHVSMGPIACRKALEITQNVAHVLAIEALTACQALDLQPDLPLSRPIRTVYERIRQQAPSVTRDRSMSQEMGAVAQWILAGELAQGLEVQ